MRAQSQTVCVSRRVETQARSETCITPIMPSKYFKAVLASDKLHLFYYNIFEFQQNLPDEAAHKACHEVTPHP